MIAASPEMLAGTPNMGSLTYDAVKGIMMLAEPKDLRLSWYFKYIDMRAYIQLSGRAARFGGERLVVLDERKTQSRLTNKSAR